MKTLSVVIFFSLSVFAGDPTAVDAVKIACGPDAVKFNVRSSEGQLPAPPPVPGKALVYVVEKYERPGNELGTPTLRVGLDGSWVGANRGTSHLFFPVEAGEHHLCSDWQSAPFWIGARVSLTSLTAEPGQTYYFRARVMESSPSVWILDLDPINSDEGRLLVGTSPLSDYRQKK
jgi:hypothetical protein